MMTRFTNRNDICNWVWDHVGDNLDRRDVEKITDCIRTDANFPGWGQDATVYLDSLPALVDLLDDQQRQQDNPV